MPCSPLKVKERFGGKCRPHLRGRRISRTRNQRESLSESNNTPDLILSSPKNEILGMVTPLVFSDRDVNLPLHFVPVVLKFRVPLLASSPCK
jgi:hypothetical protein